MPLVYLILILGLLIGVAGAFVLFIFFLSVIVGGLYDLFRVLVDRREDRRRERGLCPRCGYDMRASRRCCPECGLPTRVFPHPHFLHL